MNLKIRILMFNIDYNLNYNIAFVNSERWLAKSRVDITLCQHGKFPATLLLRFFVLYYKRNIKHFFRIDIQLYQHSWKLDKYNFLETPGKWIITELSIRKLGSSSVLIIMHWWRSELTDRELCDNKLTWCFHKIIF